jgi:hypothetical protein
MSEKRGRGQPKFEPTPDQRSLVKLLRRGALGDLPVFLTVAGLARRRNEDHALAHSSLTVSILSSTA